MVMEQSEISLRLGAADLMATYQRLADLGRVDELGQLFAEDAVFQHNSAELVGRRSIVGFFSEVGAGFASSGILPARHHLSSVLVEPSGDTEATTYGYFAVLGVNGLDHWGTYTDQVYLSEGRWLFRRRCAIVEGSVPASPTRSLLKLDEA